MSSLEKYLEFASGPSVAVRIQNEIDNYKTTVVNETDNSIQELMQRQAPTIQSSNALQNALESAKAENRRIQKTLQDQKELSTDWKSKRDEHKALILEKEAQMPDKEQVVRDQEQALRNQHQHFSNAEHFIQRCTNNILMNGPMQKKLSRQSGHDRLINDCIADAMGGPK